MMIRFTVLTLGFTLTAAAMAGTPEDYYRIYPTRFNATTDTLWHNSFLIINSDTDNSVRLKVDPITFDVGEAGPFNADTSLIPSSQRQYSLIPYLHYSPKYLALGPLAERNVNVRVTIPADLAPGTYWAGLKFIQQTPQKNPLLLKRNPKDELDTEAFALIDETVPVYIDVKPEKRDLSPIQLSCQIKDHRIVTFEITNPTHFAFEPFYKIQVKELAYPYRLRPFPVMPESKATRQMITYGYTITSDTFTYNLPDDEDKTYKITCKSV